MTNLKITELLEFCFKKRAKYVLKNKIEAYRLLDYGESQLPLAIDIYKDNAVLHVFDQVHGSKFQEIESALRAKLKIKNFYYKNRTKQNLDLPVALRSIPGKHHQKEITIYEYRKKFLCNLSDYLDTGLFLDHRETRKWIEEQSKGKMVLNTFAYTGSFTIYAAAGGAQKTYSVDLSKTYCDWIKKNLELNHQPLERNWVYKMDTLEFFKYAQKKNLKFDVIIIDPPSFSRNKGCSFSVQKDHPELINRALELLNPKGFVLFSNNKQDFKLSKEKLLPSTIQNIQRETIPPDFTRHNAHYCFLIWPL